MKTSVFHPFLIPFLRRCHLGGRETKGLVLKQKLPEWNQGELRDRAEFLIEYGEKYAFAGKRYLSDNLFCTDFSNISECDVSFLQSFLSYMKPREDFWEQLKILIPEYAYPAIQPISKLMETAQKRIFLSVRQKLGLPARNA